MKLRCRLGLHAKVPAAEPGLGHDLYRCRRCPAQWRIGSHGYSWGEIRYRDRIADAAGPYDHTEARWAEAAERAWWIRAVSRTVPRGAAPGAASASSETPEQDAR